MPGSNVSVFDSTLYSPLFTQHEMKGIWSDDNLIQSWLTFEITIARVQAIQGLIPQQAVVSIEAVCNASNIDWPRLAQDTQTVGMAIKPLVDQLTEQGDDHVKKYLHWGCTTQDLLDTSLAMRVKQTLDLVRTQLVSLGNQLEKMAIAHKHTVMVARTNSMDALPTTWGLQVSSYLQEITRHIVRLDNLYPRATTGMYGGAVGNLSSIGPQGLAVRKGLFAELGLTEPKGLGNASLDNIAELIQFFALVHGTLCRIANDTETMGRAPMAEVREGESGGGSSTMPHKANPRAANMIQTLSRMGWMYASSAPNLMDQHDVRSASMRVLNWSLVPESSLAVSTALERAQRLVANLVVNKPRMRDNFEASRNFIMSEAVMMKVADKVGRGEGYSKVKAAIANAHDTGSLADVLKLDGEVSAILSPDEIDDACNPQLYLGCNDALIDETVAQYRQLLS
ncbi:class-II fumarase/aspartase family protein [Photobacterium lutimaris]|uniref:Adenylosuccinate lyase family protein n=1 Tax=Photobacterium lutimaris TaxID=388278 RepID=A0A2T3J594_9GAMM|nr:adenylosuccinate lyase family protein [Photobacterium lutimaris]PSU36454.1 adenylosuccinate lyase family protein [Photobacterium lutimaris]TDR78694.1 3-carboxy-cis,cis-muconate cycloisomerase [Photobacterium lutimaris]